MPTEMTKSQAIDFIKNQEFDKLFGKLDTSFYQSFLDDISEYLPDFHGAIFGYRGTVIA